MAFTKRGGPYPSPNQSFGQVPSLQPDTNLCIVFLALYTAAGLAHFGVLLRNKKRGHKFLVNGVVFGFCKVRIITFALRDAWASHPDSLGLGLASTVFVYAGIFLLLGANLVFTQRILRAQHPKVGWSKPVSIGFPVVGGLTVVSIIMIIVAVLESFFTLNEHSKYIDHALQLYGLTYLSVVALLPVPIVLASSVAGLLPNVQVKRRSHPVDKFGDGRMTYNVVIVVASGIMLSIGCIFRAVINYLTPVPIDTPGSQPPVPAPQPWYFSKASFYTFNFVLELIVILGWLGLRIDRRFHVPDGAKGTYQESTTTLREKKGTSVRDSHRMSTATQVPDGADQVVVLDAFFGDNQEGFVAGAAAHGLQEVLNSAMKQWQIDHEIVDDQPEEIDVDREARTEPQLEPEIDLREQALEQLEGKSLSRRTSIQSDRSLEVQRSVASMRPLSPFGSSRHASARPSIDASLSVRSIRSRAGSTHDTGSALGSLPEHDGEHVGVERASQVSGSGVASDVSMNTAASHLSSATQPGMAL